MHFDKPAFFFFFLANLSRRLYPDFFHRLFFCYLLSKQSASISRLAFLLVSPSHVRSRFQISHFMILHAPPTPSRGTHDKPGHSHPVELFASALDRVSNYSQPLTKHDLTRRTMNLRDREKKLQAPAARIQAPNVTLSCSSLFVQCQYTTLHDFFFSPFPPSRYYVGN